MNIYEITGNYLQVQELIEQGELCPQMLTDTLEGIEGEIESKADGYAKIIKNLTKDTEGLKAESKRINDKKRSIDNNIKAMKTNLQQAMEVLDKKKFKTDLFSFGIQKNKASVVVEDESSFSKYEFLNLLITYKDELLRYEQGIMTPAEVDELYTLIIEHASSYYNIKISIEPDKAEIYKTLKEGLTVEGAKLVQSESLRIR